MNFFEQQNKARKRTAQLIFYFVLAIIFTILSIDALLVGALIFINDPSIIDTVLYGQPRYYYPQGSSLIIDFHLIWMLALRIGLLIAPVIIVIILLGSFIRSLTLSAGGVAVAEMANAEPIDLSSPTPLEKRFINVVEEMSIAAGIPVPKLYIMKNEKSINAFVAGLKPEDTVMVVTMGALEQLNRDELQGVVGHEFSHIFNSDMKVSVRLIGILGGLLFLSQLGYYILRINSLTPRSQRSENEDARIKIAIMIVGIGLFIIGYISLFFGRLIKAAISRQRELLADASSVQYTREPSNLVRALIRIQNSEEGTHLTTKHAEDISHLCFMPSLPLFFNHLLATHPPIEERIQALDPEGIYRKIT